MKKILIYVFVFLLVAITVEGKTVWVSKTGSATSPYDTEEKGFTTIGEAVTYCDTNCDPGDIVKIGDGTYVERITISHSGSSEGYITYMPKNDWAVTIDGSLKAWASTVVISGDYIKLEGLNITRGGDYSLHVQSTASYTYIKDCFISHEVTSSQNYTYSEVFHNSGSYGLVEDSFLVGGARYIINTQGGEYNVYRRVVVRWDWTRSNVQPIGGFYDYHEEYLGGGNNTYYQNCIAIDFNTPTGHTGTVAGGFGSNYGENIFIDGSISMNLVGCGTECWNGIFDQSDSLDGDTGTNYINNVVVINSAAGYRFVRGGRSNLSNLSFFLNDAAIGYMHYPNTITNSLFYDNGKTSTQNITYSYSHFYNQDSSGSNATTGDPGIIYPVKIEASSPIDGTGSSASNRGAEILYRIGVDGTHYDQTGWNTLTAVKLWPFPNEAQIRQSFKSVASAPSGVIPETNDPNRGFAADDHTLTEFILNSLSPANPITVEGISPNKTTVAASVDEFIYGESGETDEVDPVIAISDSDPKTLLSGYTTTLGFISSDANGIDECKWRSGSAPDESNGTACTGTTSGTCSVTGLVQGNNTIYVGCADPSNNWGSDSITINAPPYRASAGGSYNIR